MYIPHPFDAYRSSRLRHSALEAIRAQVDILEVFNARNVRLAHNAAARAYMRTRIACVEVLAATATSPVRWAMLVELPDFGTPSELLAALEQGVVRGRRSHPVVHVQTAVDKRLKRWQATRAG